MGTSLNGLTPAGTYPGLIKTGDNAPIDGTLKTLSDGNGNNLPMAVSTTAVNFTNQLQQSGVAVPTASQVAAKQDTLVSGTNIKTINGTSVLGPGNIAVVTSPSGVAGAIQFSNGSAFASDASNLFWDNTNKRLGVGTNAPTAPLTVQGVGSNIATFLDSNGNERIKFDSAGGIQSEWAITAGGSQGYRISGKIFIQGSSDGVMLLTNSGGDNFNRMQFGGTSSSFPSIKRNGAEINFRLADDSGFCNIEAGQIKTGAGTFSSNTLFVSSGGGLFLGYGGGGGNLNLFPNSGTTAGAILYTTGFIIGSASINASAKLQVESTTQGFLPPRMTTTQKNAIASPAAGLVVYDSTTNKLCCYNGSTWNDLF